jgi:hypothetical protein
VCEDRLQQVIGSAIVQKEYPLPKAPQRLAAGCVPLRYAVSPCSTHVVKLEIAVGEIDNIALVSEVGISRLACYK